MREKENLNECRQFSTSGSNSFCKIKLKRGMLGGPSRWWRSNTWRSPSSPQIHQKYIYMWKNSYRTPTEPWQKTSECPKDARGRPTCRGRAKSKAEPQELCEQRREREFSLSSLRSRELNLHNELDVPCICGIPE